MTDLFLVNKNGDKLPIDKNIFTGFMLGDSFFEFEQIEMGMMLLLDQIKNPLGREITIPKEPEYNTQGIHIHIHYPEANDVR